ncbi:ribonuclease H-like domain-containing protein [Tanacetum coccineum]
MWLFRHKYHADDTLSRYKARILANGSTQLEGVDVDETFSLVVKPDTIRTVLSLAASQHWPFTSLMSRMPFYTRSLYGLKQTPRAWFQCFASYIIRVGFHHSCCDSSLFVYIHGMDTAYLLIYVDDNVLTASSQKYVVDILERAHMVNCNPSRNPVDTESKLGIDGDPVSDPTLYRSLTDDVDISALTMVQSIALIPDDIKTGIVNPKIGDDVKFEINTNFMRELRRKLFTGTDDEDAYEHARTVLEIMDLFHFPGVTRDAIMLRDDQRNMDVGIVADDEVVHKLISMVEKNELFEELMIVVEDTGQNLTELDSIQLITVDPESDKWLDAMNAKIQSTKDNRVWCLVDLPPNGRTFGNMRAIRILLAIVAFYDYEIWQIDVKIVFLNGHLSEDIYMVQPKGFVDPKHPSKVGKKVGFTQNPYEPCVYVKASGSNVAFLVLYVDDILIIRNIVIMLQDVKSWLCSVPMQEKPNLSKAQGASTHSELNPGEAHWTAVKTILKYLKNTKDMVLVYGGKPETELVFG